jgi:CHAD domain-containing protein
MTDYKTYAQETISRHFVEFARRASAIPAGKDIEDVHQLRVSFRRLNNAAKVFKDVVPPSEFKKWKKKIASLLQISSQARDIDVQIHFLKSYQKRIRNYPQQMAFNSIVSHGHARGTDAVLARGLALPGATGEWRGYRATSLDKLVSRLEKKRAQIQPRLVAAIQSLGFDKAGTSKYFFALVGETHQSTHPASLAQRGEKKISKRLRKMLSLASVVSQPDAHAAHHQLRIAAKHLRYTVEDFIPFYGREAGRVAARVKEIQDVLGDMHDSCVRIHILPTVMGRQAIDRPMKELLQSIIESCQRSHDQAYRKLVSVWQQAQDEELWERLTDLVSLPLGKGKK